MKIDPNGLLSKWGFDDGDILNDLLHDNGYGEEWKKDEAENALHWFDHRVLIRVVKEHVLSMLDQKVEVFDVGSAHNPIRASSIDGVKYSDWFGTLFDIRTLFDTRILTPIVEVTDKVILAIAEEEAR